MQSVAIAYPASLWGGDRLDSRTFLCRWVAKADFWRTLSRRGYQEMEVGDDGPLRSKVFPGLWLDVPALIRGDMLQVQAVLQQGLASPEHAAFVRGHQRRQ